MPATTWTRAYAILLALSIARVTLPGSALAQQIPPVPGTELRAIVAEERWPALFGEQWRGIDPTVEGTVAWATADSLGFPWELEAPQPNCSFCPRTRASGTVRVAYRDLIELQVREVVGNRAGSGFVGGAIGGGLIGVLSGSCLGLFSSGCIETQPDLATVGIGVLLGGGLGYIIGRARPQYGEWTYVSLDAWR